MKNYEINKSIFSMNNICSQLDIHQREIKNGLQPHKISSKYQLNYFALCKSTIILGNHNSNLNMLKALINCMIQWCAQSETYQKQKCQTGDLSQTFTGDINLTAMYAGGAHVSSIGVIRGITKCGLRKFTSLIFRENYY